LRHYLKLLDITDFVSAAVTGADVEKEKPAPDLIPAAARQLQADNNAGIWVVGDTPYDAQAALAAGATPVGTLGGGFTGKSCSALAVLPWPAI
jgi:phosphoglycolate phosphatase-like HAD superfamily hydrolase